MHDIMKNEFEIVSRHIKKKISWKILHFELLFFIKIIKFLFN